MKADFAFDRMSDAKLWRMALEELYWLDPQAGPSIAGHSRELAWRRLRGCLRELHVRGIQLGLGTLADEKVSGKRRVDPGGS
jgi:hypothetical protein